jgi:hypothetical protein
VAENKEQSMNQKLAYAVEMVERAAGQYVNFVVDVSRKFKDLEGEIVFLKKAVVSIPGGSGSSKPKILIFDYISKFPPSVRIS